jgi:hypothetical protein
MATQPVSPNDELVEVFGSKEESEVMVVRGLLEAAGIECLVTSLEAPQDVLPGVGGLVVRVPADRAEEARRVIEESQNPLPEDAETDEFSATADSTPEEGA